VQPPQAADIAALASPDWARQADDVCCPMCDYNLRGLTEPRCPECGYRFVWKDLLDAKARTHAYLYEHHPESNRKAFWKTVWNAALRPRAFWNSLNPAQPSRPRRLVRYWFACARLLAYPLLALWLQRAVELTIGLRGGAGSLFQRLFDLDTAPWTLGFYQQLCRENPAAELGGYLILACWVWPWLTYAVLLIFAQTMRRSRVRPIHALRCTIYAGGVAVWSALLLLAGVLALWLFTAGTGTTMMRIVQGDGGVYVLFLLAALSWAWMTYALAVAYRRYMQFHRPVATVLASQVIVGLVYLNVIAAQTWF
jgi:hypothetical protein